MLLALTPVPAVAQDAAVQTFDIPSQEASSALLRLCVAADCELAFVGRPGHAVRTRAVRGRMTWRQALDRMLEGTALRRRFVGARGVRVWAEPTPPTDAIVSPPAPAPEVAELEAITVVGRLSDQIDESLRRKREADVISDGVSSERIGDLPAANLAEALQRVPGVAIEREVGEGQFVSVRGLGPLFQSVTLNGAPVAFNENIRNSTQSGRQFRFRALSVDLLAGARLTKSATPDLIDGGIGSNIDIETAGGLGGEPFLSVRLGAEAEERTGRLSPDLSIAGRLVSADGDRGVVAGVSQEERSVRYDRFQIMRYGETVIDGRPLIVPNDIRTTVERENRRRRSAFVGADWRVSPELTLDVDALVSTFDNAIREDRLVYGLGERLGRPGSTFALRNGEVVAAKVADGRIDNNTEISDQDHLNLIVSAGAEMTLGDWRLTPRVSGSLARSVLDTPLERMSAQSPEGVGYAFDLGDAAASRRAARLTTDFDLTDPTLLKRVYLGVRAVESRDDDLTLLLDARRPLGLNWGPVRLSALRLGGQFSDRGRDYQRRDREATLRAGASAGGLHSGVTPADVFEDLVSWRSAPWVTADFAAFRDAFEISDDGGDVVFRPDDVRPTGADLQNSYQVGERVAAAYARLDFDGTAGQVPFFGNVGIRAVQTRTTVDGALLGLTDGVLKVRPVEYEGSHGVLLPSANLAFDLDDHTVLRLAASRSITRPSLADLRAATVPASVLVSSIYEYGQAAIDDPEPGVIFSGVGGNPHLTPYVAANLDMSWERTLPRGAVSVALFHKTIDDFIRVVAAPELLTFETRAGPPVQAEVLMARPRNVGRATVDGVEVSLHRRLADGLGLWASGSWTRSRIDGGGRISGVSDWAWSVSPFFEHGPLALNASWSWRSAFRSEADMQGGGVSAFIVGSAGYLDAQASLDVSRHAQVVLSATNLTDTRDLAYEVTPDRLLLGSVGRAMTLGVRLIW